MTSPLAVSTSRLLAACSLWMPWTTAHGQEAPSPEECVWSRLSGEVAPASPPASAEDLAAALHLTVVRTDRDGNAVYGGPRDLEFVFIPGGPARLGSDYSDVRQPWVESSAAMARETEKFFRSEQPAIDVWISPFFLGTHEITVAQYRVFLDAVANGETAPFEYPMHPPVDHTPFLFDDPDVPFWDDRQPVVGIGWASAYTFCRWVGGRLPTEAEWSKAARTDDRRVFPWGNDPAVGRANLHGSLNYRTVPVGMYPGGRNPYGLYDLCGNALEYTHDAFVVDVMGVLPLKDPCLLEVNSRVGDGPRSTRGGSWNSATGRIHRGRSAARTGQPTRLVGQADSTSRLMYLQGGFRVALSTTPDLYPEGWLDQRRAALNAHAQDD